jgi:hypothetical protein
MMQLQLRDKHGKHAAERPNCNGAVLIAASCVVIAPSGQLLAVAIGASSFSTTAIPSNM